MEDNLPRTPIVLAFTPNYLVPAATCILSILQHSERKDRYHIICLMSSPLSSDSKLKLRNIDKERLQFTFIDLGDRLNGIQVNQRYTVAASYRLLLPEILSEFDKVIYVDCDVIVRNNLAELYCNVDLGNNYLAGVYEATLEFQLAHMKAIGCEPGRYINSGFLLMNLELLRRGDMTSRFIEALKAEGLEFPDQDVLNKLCKDRILSLPPYYNSIRTFFLPQYKKEFLKYYTEKDWELVQSHGNIHYTGAKPWEAFTIRFADWWKYYEVLPEDIKAGWMPNKKMHQLYQIYKTAVGRFAMDGVLASYRKVKYGSV